MVRKLILAIVAAALWTVSAQAQDLPAAPTPSHLDVFALPPAQLVDQARADLALVQRYAGQVEQITQRLQVDRKIWRSDRPLLPEQKARLRSAWGAVYTYMGACETVRQRWWMFLGRERNSPAHAWGYVVTHSALLAELGVGGQFAELVVGAPAVEVLLDEADDSFGMPARAFEAWKLVVIHAGTAAQVLTGDAYLPMIRKQLTAHAVQASAEGKAALGLWPRWSKAARKVLTRDVAGLFWRNTADLLRDWTRRAVLPPQTAIAEWMGDTRVRRIGQPLIAAAQIGELQGRLQPGDIALARQNWYLSNLGLPGFWPHAELVLGRPEQWPAVFDGDPSVQAWLASLPEKPATLAKLLEQRFPKAWLQFSAGRDYQGHGPIWVMESISEGVSLTAPEHALQVDYLAVLRPRLPALVKAKALLRAFGYHGKPYDFDFDFLSDRSLVCTELVWKSYQPESRDSPGLTIGLLEVAGRPTLPANEIARLFDAQAGLAEPQLEFVAFLEGQEAGRKAVWRDAAALRATWKRPKWDIAQK
jgi:hypothetical protein